LVAQSTPAESGRKLRVAELDLLRFLAAMAVAVYHVCKWPAGAESLKAVTELGFLGVQVFFVISGFVILMTAEHRTPIEFAKSRISRLYPTFWICVLITSLALALHNESPSLATVAANLTMLPPLFHQPFVDLVYWTLVVELRFYALVLVLLLLGQMRRVEAWLALWVLALAVTHLPAHPPMPLLRGWHALQWVTLDVYGSLFAAGCYFYLLRTRGPSVGRIVPLGVCLLISIVDVCTVQDGSNYPWTHLQIGSMALVVAATYGAFLALALQWWRLPASRVWFWVGGLTYPLYLIHAQAGRLLWLALPGSEWVRSALVLLASLLAAVVLARYSERRACGALHHALDRLETRLRARFNWRGSPAGSAG
jgi:peptidoglycan/LPS O-acetylase OafA/YrhL